MRCLHLALVVAVILTLANMNTSSRRPPARALISDADALHQVQQARSVLLESQLQQLSMMGGVRHRLDASFWLGLQQPRSAAPDPVPAHCESAFGSGYLRRWNQTQFEFCRPAADQPEGKRSSIRCYTDAQSPGREKAGGLQTLCRSKNLLLDSDAFMGGSGGAGGSAGSHHGGDHASVQAPGAQGSVRAACSADKGAYEANLAAPSSAPWFLKSLQVGRASAAACLLPARLLGLPCTAPCSGLPCAAPHPARLPAGRTGRRRRGGGGVLGPVPGGAAPGAVPHAQRRGQHVPRLGGRAHAAGGAVAHARRAARRQRAGPGGGRTLRLRLLRLLRLPAHACRLGAGRAALPLRSGPPPATGGYHG
jgi:hypothetical protein